MAACATAAALWYYYRGRYDRESPARAANSTEQLTELSSDRERTCADSSEPPTGVAVPVGARYRMVATDMDCTLLDASHSISERAMTVLRELHRLGIHIVLCSGRMLHCLTPYESRLQMDLNLVCYNGAVVVGSRYCKHSHVMSTVSGMHMAYDGVYGAIRVVAGGVCSR